MTSNAELTNDEALYEARINFFESFVLFHGNSWEKTDIDDREALSLLFFAGRVVNVDNVHAYRRKVLAQHPELASRSEQALRRFLEANNVDIRGLMP